MVASLVLLCLAGAVLLPPVRERLAWHVNEITLKVKYALNPPEKEVFVPQQAGTLAPTDTRLPTSTPSPTPVDTPISVPTDTPFPTLPPTVPVTPIPESVSLQGVRYEDQHGRLNYCAPANLSMALSYWGWNGNRDVVGPVLKPDDKDKNVMPYEMVDFVNEETEFRALQRYGGDMELVKRLIVAGFPVVIEKGYYERDYAGKVAWLGHYSYVTGYDDARQVFIWQDTYPPPQCKGNGRDVEVSYKDFIEGWRSFNYLFIVVYPPAREAELLNLLGPWSDAGWAARHALETAEAEIQTLEGIDLFFAWFAKGTSHVALQQYADAAIAYDQAFKIYNNLDNSSQQRPYRMLWYQTGPYFAYYYSMRYQDVIDLADTTLTETISKPTLEESLLWRGRAYYMIGQTQQAIDDYRAALKIHANWGPAVQALQDLGVVP